MSKDIKEMSKDIKEMSKDINEMNEKISNNRDDVNNGNTLTADHYYRKGNEYRQRGDWQHAIDCYLEAISLDPNSPAVHAKQMLDNWSKNGGLDNIMAEKEVMLMKGNEAIAHAAIRCGADGYFGYPITPQSEVLETLAKLKPWETTGMVVLQAESEVASINMIYGGAGAGKRVFTSSSSPGIALMQEGIAYMAGAELPGVFVNVQRGGPGLGTIQPSQSDYLQATRGGGNGDYNVIVLAPNSVQEMADFMDLAFTLAFRYRNPAMILSDGVIGQMMEKVVLPEQKPRRTEEEVIRECPWASTGRTRDRKPNIITSLELMPEAMEQRNLHLQEKYRTIKEREVRYETIELDDADIMIVAFGSAARIAEKAIELAREEGIKAGLFRPITLWPFPEKQIAEAAHGKRGVLVAEINAGQMIQDVRLSVNGEEPVEHFGRLGGIVPEPEEIVKAIKEKLL